MSCDAQRDEKDLQAVPGVLNVLDVDGERALWAAVLHQAVHDATRPVVALNTRGSQTSTTAAEQADARAFLADVERLGPVCELLGIDTDWFIRHIVPQKGDLHV